MKIKFNNQRGFTLVEIMMVVIIIGILAVLAIPRYKKYLTESKLSEVQINIGEIKQGESKYYNSHGQKYRGVLSGEPAVGGESQNDKIERLLRIELGAKEFFDYYIATYGGESKKGYVLKAKLNDAGIDEYGFEDDPTNQRCIWFIYPPRNRPRDAADATKYDEKWYKGWNDEEFFNSQVDAESELVDSVTHYNDDGSTEEFAITW